MSLSHCTLEAMEKEIADLKVKNSLACELINKFSNEREEQSARIKVRDELIKILQRELDDA